MFIDTSGLTDLSEMFFDKPITQISFTSQFNTEDITTFQTMFSGSQLIHINISTFDTSNVNSMHSMFSGCKNLKSVILSNFNNKKLKYLIGMFSGCSSLENVTFINFNTEKVEQAYSMFRDCNKLTYIDISSFKFNPECDLRYFFSKDSAKSNGTIKLTKDTKTIIEQYFPEDWNFECIDGDC